MWYFNSPLIVFGEDALNELSAIQGRRAFVVTDEVLLGLGHVDRVTSKLKEAGLEVQVFAQDEPDPSLQTV
jgi:acetaldehyde dehydrogenase/alcohol dehydrogenase